MRRLSALENCRRRARGTTSVSAPGRVAAVKLSQQREQDVRLLNSRLNDLLASRWRKLGQRIGVTMVLPWEESLNGHRKHH
jgi:hypothetical protein